MAFPLAACDWIHSLAGDGVDAVFDPVGGAGKIWRSHRTLCRGGRLVSFVMAAMSKAGVQVNPFSLLTVLLLKVTPDERQSRMSQNLAEFAPARPDWYRETLAELFELVPAGKIKLVVAQRIPLVEAARAHELLECGGYAGKVVLVAANGKASDGTHKKW